MDDLRSVMPSYEQELLLSFGKVKAKKATHVHDGSITFDLSHELYCDTVRTDGLDLRRGIGKAPRFVLVRSPTLPLSTNSRRQCPQQDRKQPLPDYFDLLIPRCREQNRETCQLRDWEFHQRLQVRILCTL